MSHRTLLFVAALLLTSLANAQTDPNQELVALARTNSPQLAAALTEAFSDADLKAGRAARGYLSDIVFAVSSPTQPTLTIDNAPGPELRPIPNTPLWSAVANIPGRGHLHEFYYTLGGKRFGGSTDLPVLGPESYLKPGIPSGTLSKQLTYTSKIYDGMVTSYWTYAPAQYDPKTPAALMVMQDGQAYISRDGGDPFLNTIDNLIAEKKIPVMICVFISPGHIAGAPGTPTYNAVKAYADKWKRPLEDAMRSTLYDTVSDRYPRFLRDEILAEVSKTYNIRKDAYSRGITGASSGGIASFNAAWQQPGQFSRVISWIGSFVSLQWNENPGQTGGPIGGQDYPDLVLRGPKRNLRVWLEDGSRDMEFGFYATNYGSWPAASFRMANALKFAGYDFAYSFTQGSHSGAGGAAELPAELTWLWRDYDPARTSQDFTQSDEEKKLPPFRFTLVDRATDH